MSWRKVLNQISYWTLPPGIDGMLRSLWFSAEFSPKSTNADNYQELLEINDSLLNAYLGKRCFILGTGPSIKKQNLLPLREEICIAVSNFFVHPDYDHISPRFHCIAPHHPPITEEAWQKWVGEIAVKTRDSTLLFGLSDLERNRHVERLSTRNQHYLNFEGTLSGIATSGISLSRALPPVQSVTVMALYVAIYLGFSKIYLLGCDHDAITHLHTSSHFYDESEHAMVRSGYNENFQADFEACCRDYIQLWQQYKTINNYCAGRQVQIYNATPSSYLDVFPRVLFDDVLA